MRTNYMMTVDDVMEELGVKRSKAYSIWKKIQIIRSTAKYTLPRSVFRVNFIRHFVSFFLSAQK